MKRATRNSPTAGKSRNRSTGTPTGSRCSSSTVGLGLDSTSPQTTSWPATWERASSLLTDQDAGSRTSSPIAGCWIGRATSPRLPTRSVLGSSRSVATRLADHSLLPVPIQSPTGLPPLPSSFDGATSGMPALVRFVLWLGRIAPPLTRPYVAFMARMAKSPDSLKKGIESQLSNDEAALLSTPRFDGR